MANELVSRGTLFLQRLSFETEETVNITTLDGPDIIFLQRIVSQHVPTPKIMVGTRLPAFCTSSGLAMLSVVPETEARAILEASDRVKHTPYTITDVDQILERLRKIREAGYVHTENELYLGEVATAVPIMAADGSSLGAINAAITGLRWKGPKDEARISSQLMSAARAISSLI